MPIAARHRDDPVPPLPALAGFAVRREISAATMAALQGRTEEEIAGRFASGHRAYLAHMNDVPAAWGWVATRVGDIGETGTTFRLPDRERYLWNFVTRSEHRGRGLYPRLLNAIVTAESSEAVRFWIAYAPENHASGAGVRKAGFVTIAALSFDQNGRPALEPLFPGAAGGAARLLGLPVSQARLAQCWRCTRTGALAERTCASGPCRCDYQRPQSGCAA